MHMHTRPLGMARRASTREIRRMGKQMSINKLCNWFALAMAIGFLTAGNTVAADSPEKVAATTDSLLRQEVPFANAAKKAPARIDDERFLRRMSLDIIGRLPTPEEVTIFALD